MSECWEKLPHDKCGSSDALQTFKESNKFTGFCFNCSTYIPDPYGDSPPSPLKAKITKTAEEIAEEMAEIASLPTVDLPSRSLRKETLEYFGVKTGLSEQDGTTPVTMHVPVKKQGQITAWKSRLLSPKTFWAVGDAKGHVDLFGWEQAIASGSKRLMITEGEPDACALFQALKDRNRSNPKYADYNPAVVSLVNGSSSVKKALTDHQKAIRDHFKEVVFVFDMDKAGRDAVEEGMKIIPTAISASLPEKDANDCLIKGKALALANAVLFNSAAPKNTRLVCGTSLYGLARQPAEWGLSWPWPLMTKYTRGIRYGETIYIGAGVKMGKSTVVNELATHMMLEHNLPIFLAKPEEANNKTIKKILGTVASKLFDDPNVPFDNDAYDAASEKIGDKLWMLSLYQHLDWQHLKQDIVAAVNQHGCKAVFIDPITNLTNGISAGEANTELQGIAQDLSAMSMDMQFTAFIFCHLKSPLSGDPHERGGQVLSSQFAGSRAMMRSANYMIGLEGDKNPDMDEELRNYRDLTILEDREFGVSGKVPLYYDPTTGRLNARNETS